MAHYYAVPRAGTRRAAVWTDLGLPRIRLRRPDAVAGTFLRVMSTRCAIETAVQYYLGDPTTLTEAQVARMVAWASERFNVSAQEARALMMRDGVPILANDEIEVVEEAA